MPRNSISTSGRDNWPCSRLRANGCAAWTSSRAVGDDDHHLAARVAQEVPEQVHGVGSGPVDVVEHDQAGADRVGEQAGDRLEQALAAGGGTGRGAGSRAAGSTGPVPAGGARRAASAPCRWRARRASASRTSCGNGWKCSTGSGSHVPTMTVAPGTSTVSVKRLTSTLLPIPPSPPTSTSCGVPSTASAQLARSASSSAVRPTKSTGRRLRTGWSGAPWCRERVRVRLGDDEIGDGLQRRPGRDAVDLVECVGHPREHLQRVRLLRAVEQPEHELTGQRLVGEVVVDERLQHVDHLVGPVVLEERRRVLAQRVEVQPLEPFARGVDRRDAEEAFEGPAPPLGARRHELGARLAGVPRVGGGAGARDPGPEPVDVDAVERDAEVVAAVVERDRRRRPGRSWRSLCRFTRKLFRPGPGSLSGQIASPAVSSVTPSGWAATSRASRSRGRPAASIPSRRGWPPSARAPGSPRFCPLEPCRSPDYPAVNWPTGIIILWSRPGAQEAATTSPPSSRSCSSGRSRSSSAATTPSWPMSPPHRGSAASASARSWPAPAPWSATSRSCWTATPAPRSTRSRRSSSARAP